MAYATCPQCDSEFTGVGYFDRHQEVGEPGPDGDGVVCLPPESVGLEQGDDGRWRDPDAEFTQTDTSGPKHVTCKHCGSEWTIARSRGRYPTSCDTISDKPSATLVDGDTCHDERT